MPPFRLESDLAARLASEFGTPLYVVSESAFVERIKAFRTALDALDANRSGSPRSRMSYASKANSTVALLKIAHREGCHIDVASEGELRAALMAGVPPRDCTLHGNNKTLAEMTLALKMGIDEVVVDSIDEVWRYGHIAPAPQTRFVLRVNPGLELDLNPKVATSSRLSKFGLPPEAEVIQDQVYQLQYFGNEAKGLHCHLGSQIMAADAHVRAAEILLDLMNKVDAPWELLNLGGGFGIGYTDETPPAFEDFIGPLAGIVPSSIGLAFEPGRSLIGEAGLTLYSVGTIKHVAGTRIVAVDGGLADNPRPAMYGSKYTVEALAGPGGEPATVVGRHCENDVLHPDVALPGNLKPGDLVQVLCTGAYSSSMASNYNRYPRPATVLIRTDGTPALIQMRETYEQMFSREIVIA